MPPTTKITEKTYISIGLVFVLLGSSSWLTTIYFQAAANSQKIDKVSQEAREDRNKVNQENHEFKKFISQQLMDIQARISRMEGAQEQMNKILKNR